MCESDDVGVSLAGKFTSSNGICLCLNVYIWMVTLATVCGTGKYPNINVKPQIPLELGNFPACCDTISFLRFMCDDFVVITENRLDLH